MVKYINHPGDHAPNENMQLLIFRFLSPREVMSTHCIVKQLVMHRPPVVFVMMLISFFI